MTARRELPHDFAALPFSRRRAIEVGIPDWRLKAADLNRPFHGVRASSNATTDLRWRCLAYQEWMNPAHCFSHQTAAELYGLPTPLYASTTDLHVTAPTPMRAPESAGIAGHQTSRETWQPTELVLRDELTAQPLIFRVVTPQLLWAQLAPVLDADDLVALGDAIVTKVARPGILCDPILASAGDLEAMAALYSGRRGARAMITALSRVRSGSLSRPESLLRLMILSTGFPEPMLNAEIRDDEGHGVALADLSWPEFRVLVEYEGDYHRRSTSKYRSDVTRGEWYADAGWFQLRAHADDVFADPNPFLRRLSRRLQDGGWLPTRELRQISSARW